MGANGEVSVEAVPLAALKEGGASPIREWRARRLGPMLRSMPARHEGPQTTVALISDNHLLRLGFQERARSEHWIRLIEPTATSLNVGELILHDHPNVIILDCQITTNRRAVIQRIKGSAPEVKLILLCHLDEAEHSRQMLGAVIDAIVLKVQPAQVLIATIKHLMDIPQQATPQIRTDKRTIHRIPASIPTPGNPSENTAAGLTERERHIVRLVVEGLSNKEIAARLHLADTTVRHQLTRIFDKLGVSNRQNLLIYAHRRGIE